MSVGLEVPPVSSSSEEHADWLELNAIAASGRTSSYHDLVRCLRRSGTADATCESLRDHDGYVSSVADAALFELAERRDACEGLEDLYPFRLEGLSIGLSIQPEDSVYVFLLLLSYFGKDAGPKGLHGERVFEDVCSHAAASYFGAPHPHVGARVFGFPRRVLPSKFAEAVGDLCECIGEGGGNRTQPDTSEQKDAKLDVVVWRGFPDGRRAKLIGFGQCATGEHWSTKCTDLQPSDWCVHWMMDAPLVAPIKLFFVPHRIEQARWDHTGRFGGIVFDRCRVALHSSGLHTNVRELCRRWSRHVIRHRLAVSSGSRPSASKSRRAKTRSSRSGK